MIDSVICTDNPNNYQIWGTLWDKHTIYFKHHTRFFDWAKQHKNELQNIKYIILDRYTGNHDAIKTKLSEEIKELGFLGFLVLSSHCHGIGEKVRGFDLSIGEDPLSRSEIEKMLCETAQ